MDLFTLEPFTWSRELHQKQRQFFSAPSRCTQITRIALFHIAVIHHFRPTQSSGRLVVYLTNKIGVPSCAESPQGPLHKNTHLPAFFDLSPGHGTERRDRIFTGRIMPRFVCSVVSDVCPPRFICLFTRGILRLCRWLRRYQTDLTRSFRSLVLCDIRIGNVSAFAIANHEVVFKTRNLRKSLVTVNYAVFVSNRQIIAYLFSSLTVLAVISFIVRKNRRVEVITIAYKLAYIGLHYL